MTRPLVLVVEDVSDIAELVVFLLDSAGFAAVVAPDLYSARRRLSARPGPSLVLLDCRLPDGDGLDLCRELKASRPAPPVVVVSALAETGPTAFAAGADACLIKPFEPDRLVATVSRFALARAAGEGTVGGRAAIGDA